MVLIWLPKRYLAKALNSSVMYGEAICSLSCIQITAVLFVGSLIFRLWNGGWWIDSATSLFLGFLFGYEGIKILRWVSNPAFDGGCCDTCHVRNPTNNVEAAGTAQLSEQYRDLCSCCSERVECRESDECKCGTTETLECCQPKVGDDKRCCTHKILPGRNPKNATVRRESCCSDCHVVPEIAVSSSIALSTSSVEAAGSS